VAGGNTRGVFGDQDRSFANNIFDKMSMDAQAGSSLFCHSGPWTGAQYYLQSKTFFGIPQKTISREKDNGKCIKQCSEDVFLSNCGISDALDPYGKLAEPTEQDHVKHRMTNSRAKNDVQAVATQSVDITLGL
jgi:hypothetical protein